MKVSLWIIIEMCLVAVCAAGAIACLIAGFCGKGHCFITAVLFAAPAAAMAPEIVKYFYEDRRERE